MITTKPCVLWLKNAVVMWNLPDLNYFDYTLWCRSIRHFALCQSKTTITTAAPEALILHLILSNVKHR